MRRRTIMGNNSDPSFHQLREQQFIAHVQELAGDERLRIDTKRGRRPVTAFICDVSIRDRGVELKRLMSEMGKPDRELESHMPVGKSLELTLSQRRWWFGKSAVGRLIVVCVSPNRALLGGQTPQPMSGAEVERKLAEIPPPLPGVPQTVVLMNTSGFTPESRESADRGQDRTVILASPNESGGWTVTGPAETKATSDLFDPEAEAEKRHRIRAEIEATRVELLSSGIASDKLALRTALPVQLVEAELKSYARANSGLTSARLDGRLVLFREGAAPARVSGGKGDMPFIDRVKTLFARKGEIEKKVALLSERRTALSQQRDRGYEDMGALETKESSLREEFRQAGGEITRRRVTSQLLQLRKDIERRQQLLSVLNQQINVVSTHLHNLELQQQGKAANLPDSESIAADAAAAEEVLAELEANSELADSVGTSSHSALSDEEQSLYDELMQQAAPKAEKDSPAAPAIPQKLPAQPAAPAPAAKLPPVPQRQRSDPEPG